MTKQGNLNHLDNIKYFNSIINLLGAHSVIIQFNSIQFIYMLT
jgi:hypothetical protein